MGKLVSIALFLGACGRFGFKDQPGNAPPDVPIDQAPPIDAPPGTPFLSCDGPTRFSVPVNAAAGGMAAIATTTGYNVFAVDAVGNLAGWSYQFDGAQLAPVATGVSLGTNATGPIGGVSMGANVLLAEQYGRPNATGTKLMPIDAHVASLGGGTMRDASYFGLAPIAQSSTAMDITFLASDDANKVSAHVVTSLGVDTGTVVDVIPSAEGSSFQEIVAGGPGYTAAWTTSTTTPNATRVELLDNAFNVIAGPISTNGPGDALSPRVVWAQHANVYLVIWHEKNVAQGDDTYFEIRDQELRLLGTQQLAKTSAYGSVVASDGDGFLVVWDNYVPADHMEAVYIDAAGKMTPRSVLGTGGVPVQWAMTARYDQPALVWIESGGSGPNLYIDPVCN